MDDAAILVIMIMISAIIIWIYGKIPAQKINMPIQEPIPIQTKIFPKAINLIEWDGIHCDIMHPGWAPEHSNDIWIFFDGMPDLGNSPFEKSIIPIIRDSIRLAVTSAKSIEFQSLTRGGKPGKFGYNANVLVDGKNILSLLPALKHIKGMTPVPVDNVPNRYNGNGYQPADHFNNGLQIGNRINRNELMMRNGNGNHE